MVPVVYERTFQEFLEVHSHLLWAALSTSYLCKTRGQPPELFGIRLSILHTSIDCLPEAYL